MHTSTSNSSDRRPPQHWRRTWLLSMVIVSISLVGWELFNRSHGLWRTGTNDSERIWAEKRIIASQLGESALILIGASRIQLGIDIPRLQQLTGKEVVQLAIDGNPFMSVLEDLAADDSVTGTIIVSATVEGLSRDLNTENRAHQYLSYYHSVVEQNFRFETIETKLESQLHRYVYSISSFITPYKWFLWSDERLTQAGYLKFNSDRSIDADYSMVDTSVLYNDRIVRHLAGEEVVVTRQKNKLEAQVGYINHLVSKIEKRGGEVIFVRFPTDKRIWEIDNKRYPKSEFWDRFARLSVGRTVHFRDHQTLSDFDLPDGSHLDRGDKLTFTENLSNIIF